MSKQNHDARVIIKFATEGRTEPYHNSKQLRCTGSEILYVISLTVNSIHSLLPAIKFIF